MFTVINVRNQKDGGFYAVYSDRIETLNVADCYYSMGQLTSAGAGDWLFVQTEQAKERVFRLIEEEEIEVPSYVLSQLNDENIVSACEGGARLYDAIKALPDAEKEGIEFDYITAEGFTYWDGSNHQSVLIGYDSVGEEMEWEKSDEQGLILEAYEEKSATTSIRGLHFSFGKDSENTIWKFAESQYYGDFETFKAEKIEVSELVEFCKNNGAFEEEEEKFHKVSLGFLDDDGDEVFDCYVSKYCKIGNIEVSCKSETDEKGREKQVFTDDYDLCKNKEEALAE